jgi:hypothetical protein
MQSVDRVNLTLTTEVPAQQCQRLENPTKPNLLPLLLLVVSSLQQRRCRWQCRDQ